MDPGEAVEKRLAQRGPQAVLPLQTVMEVREMQPGEVLVGMSPFDGMVLPRLGLMIIAEQEHGLKCRRPAASC